MRVDGVLCEESLITVTDKDTTLRDMEIILKCNRVGRVISFEIPPTPPSSQEIVILTLCEVQVYGIEFPGLIFLSDGFEAIITRSSLSISMFIQCQLICIFLNSPIMILIFCSITREESQAC